METTIVASPQLGNAAILGHRTTYGAPFYWLDRTTMGDEISVETVIGEHAYIVREVLVVDRPTSGSPIRDRALG